MDTVDVTRYRSFVYGSNLDAGETLASYKQSVSTYARYATLLVRASQRIADGLVWQDETVTSLMKYYTYAKACLGALREECKLTGGFDAMEPIAFQNCRLEHGILVGADIHKAFEAAKTMARHVSFAPGSDVTLFELSEYLLAGEVFFAQD